MTQTCVRGGTLVPMAAWLPDAAFDRDWGGFAPTIGCNALRCHQCGEAVRHADHACVAAGEFVRAVDLAAVADLRQARGIVASPSGRLYACACSMREVFAPFHLTPDDDDVPRPAAPWACAGHPAWDPTQLLDGLRLDNPDEAARTAVAVLHGQAPEALPWGSLLDPERFAAYWLVRAYALLPQGDLRTALSFAVARHLDADDPAVVLGALCFFEHHPLAHGAYRSAALVARRGAWLVARQRESNLPVYDQAVTALARSAALGAQGDPATPEAVEAARRELLSDRPCGVLVFSLARTDQKWLFKMAGDVADAHPDRLDYLVATLSDWSPDVAWPVWTALGRRSPRAAARIAEKLAYALAPGDLARLVEAMARPA